MVSLKDRVWSKVRIGGEDTCWPWLASTIRRYGCFRQNGKTFYAHRFAWEYFYGSSAAGFAVCHRCDNPPCCNPHHLFIATQGENVRDMWRKGRSRQHRARLTPAIVREIRRNYAEQPTVTWKELGDRFGIQGGHAQQIVLRQIWRHGPAVG